MLSVTPHVYSQAYVTTSTQTIFSNEFVVSGYSKGGTITCFFQEAQLQPGLAGTTLEGTVTTTTPIYFYVLSSSELNGYLAAESGGRGPAGICDKLKPPSAHLTYYVSSAYSYRMRWTVPDSNDYYFVFANPGTTDAFVTFNCWSEQVTTLTLTSYRPTYSSYFTSTTPPAIGSNQLLSQGQNWFAFNNYVAYLVFLVAAGAGAVLFLIWNRGRSSSTEPKSKVVTKKQATIPKEDASPTKSEVSTSGKVFCINCGKELPTDWKFCRHCGTKQP